MIGDDIVSDVGGAQACNIRGVQVRTGKFRYDEDTVFTSQTWKPWCFIRKSCETMSDHSATETRSFAYFLIYSV